jgi:NADPH:quinone reductase-like Zn-dependent oxidoreductase
MLNNEQLAGVRQFVSEGMSNGSLVPTIARTFPFDKIIEAHRFLESGNQFEKVVGTI